MCLLGFVSGHARVVWFFRLVVLEEWCLAYHMLKAFLVTFRVIYAMLRDKDASRSSLSRRIVVADLEWW